MFFVSGKFSFIVPPPPWLRACKKNDDQRFSNYVNGNQFKKHTAKFTLCREMFIYIKQQLPIFCSEKIWCSSCIVFVTLPT